MSTAIQTVKNQVRLKEWAQEAEACRSSGLTVQQWCEMNGMSVKTYYYHLRRVREVMLSENKVVSLGTQGIGDKIEIATEDMRISLPTGCSEETLSIIIRVLKDAAGYCG